MMKITVLVFLISCAVCGAQDGSSDNAQTPHSDSSMATIVTAVMGKVFNLMDKVTQLEKELTELKSLTQGTPKVAFSAYDLGTGDTGRFHDNTPLKYKRVFSNIGNSYKPATGIFTASVKGVYFFRFSMHNSHIANSIVSLMKNDMRVVTVWDENKSDSNDIGSNAAVLPLEVGDNVYVRLYAHRLVYDDAMNYNTFTGFLLFTN